MYFAEKELQREKNNLTSKKEESSLENIFWMKLIYQLEISCDIYLIDVYHHVTMFVSHFILYENAFS